MVRIVPVEANLPRHYTPAHISPCTDTHAHAGLKYSSSIYSSLEVWIRNYKEKKLVRFHLLNSLIAVRRSTSFGVWEMTDVEKETRAFEAPRAHWMSLSSADRLNFIRRKGRWEWASMRGDTELKQRCARRCFWLQLTLSVIMRLKTSFIEKSGVVLNQNWSECYVAVNGSK